MLNSVFISSGPGNLDFSQGICLGTGMRMQELILLSTGINKLSGRATNIT